jgi:hypothetical protein
VNFGKPASPVGFRPLSGPSKSDAADDILADLAGWAVAEVIRCRLGGRLSLGIVGTFLLLIHAFDPTAKERQVCREAIDTFWTTKDLVEFERAKALIEQVRGCRLGGLRPTPG